METYLNSNSGYAGPWGDASPLNLLNLGSYFYPPQTEIITNR